MVRPAEMLGMLPVRQVGQMAGEDGGGVRVERQGGTHGFGKASKGTPWVRTCA